MDKSRVLLLKIMSSVLFGSKLPDLNDVNWEDLFTEAKMQTVFLQVFNVVSPFLPESEVSAWETGAGKIYAQNLEISREHGRMHKVMTSNGIPYVSIKGLASGKYYPQPLDRTFGDVDLVVAPDRMERAYKLLLDLGYKMTESKRVDYSNEIELHIDQGAHHVVVELHPQVGVLPPDRAGELVRGYMSELIESGQEYGIGEDTCMIPDERHHCLILLIHMAGHLTSEGIGLRHLCDWAAFVNHIPDEEFCEKYIPMLRDCGLFRFAQVMTLVCEKYLKMPQKSWSGEADPDLLKGLIKDILTGGNFGHKDPSRNQQIKYLKNYGEGTVASNNPVRQGMHSIHVKAKNRHPVLMKYYITYPLGWGAVSIDYGWMLITGKRERNNPVTTIKEAEKRNKIYQELDLYKI